MSLPFNLSLEIPILYTQNYTYTNTNKYNTINYIL